MNLTLTLTEKTHRGRPPVRDFQDVFTTYLLPQLSTHVDLSGWLAEGQMRARADSAKTDGPSAH
jgi:hypothetical protein